MYYLAISETTGKVGLFESFDGYTPRKGNKVPQRISRILSDGAPERFTVLDVYPMGNLQADLMDGIKAFAQAADPAPGTTGLWELFTKLIAEMAAVVRASATKRTGRVRKPAQV